MKPKDTVKQREIWDHINYSIGICVCVDECVRGSKAEEIVKNPNNARAHATAAPMEGSRQLHRAWLTAEL